MFKISTSFISIPILLILLSISSSAETTQSISEKNMKPDIIKLERVELYPSYAELYLYIDFSKQGEAILPPNTDINSLSVDYTRSKGLISADKSQIIVDVVIPKYLEYDYKQIVKLTDEIIDLTAEQEAFQSASNLTDRATLDINDIKNMDTILKTIIKNKQEYAKKSNHLKNIIAVKNAEKKRRENTFNSMLPQNLDRAVKLSFTGDNSARVYFKIQSFSVSWNNSYTLNLSTADGTINAKHFLAISQLTGFDWNTDIIVHTNDFSANNQNVELQPELLDIQNNNISKNVAMKSERVFNADMDVEISEGSMMKEGFTVSSNIAEVTYNIKEEIRSEPKNKNISLDSFSIKSKPEFYITPLYNRNAIIVANISMLPKNIFNGEAVLSIDNIFMGKSYIRYSELGSELKLSFGSSSMITAERKDLIARSDSGIIKSSSERGYNIILKNSFPTAKEVIVVDRIPYSTNADIKVKDIKISPKAIEKSNGILNWKLDLNKGESKDIAVRYNLDYPKGKQIISK